MVQLRRWHLRQWDCGITKYMSWKGVFQWHSSRIVQGGGSQNRSLVFPAVLLPSNQEDNAFSNQPYQHFHESTWSTFSTSNLLENFLKQPYWHFLVDNNNVDQVSRGRQCRPRDTSGRQCRPDYPFLTLSWTWHILQKKQQEGGSKSGAKWWVGRGLPRGCDGGLLVHKVTPPRKGQCALIALYNLQHGTLRQVQKWRGWHCEHGVLTRTRKHKCVTLQKAWRRMILFGMESWRAARSLKSRRKAIDVENLFFEHVKQDRWSMKTQSTGECPWWRERWNRR